MDLTTITVAQFKTRFNRDFTYSNALDGTIGAIPDPDFVQDQDIMNAFADAQVALNQGLFSTDAVITSAYLYLTAHLLCGNINAANAGIGSTGANPVNARAVGAVSESYTIPTEYTENPILAGYTTTSYGLRFLQMALPAMVGNMQGVFGGTNP